MPANQVQEDALRGELFARFEKSQRSQQGMAIWGDYAFLLYHGGHCDVMNLRLRRKIASFKLGSHTGDIAAPWANHANMAVFSRYYVRASDTFPLLYITAGNSGDADENGYYGHCVVERVQMRRASGAPAFHADIVQRIYFNDTAFPLENDNRYRHSPYEKVCWGWPAFFPDTDKGNLYLFSTRYRTNGAFRHLDASNVCIVTTFALPNVSFQKVILTPKDIKDQFTVAYDAEITQGGTLCGNQIIYSFGFGNKEFPNKIRVIDLEKREISRRIDLSDSIFCDEEIEAVDLFENQVLCNTNAGGIYLLGEKENFYSHSTSK